MQINKLFRPSVGANVSCPSPIMAFNKINGINVGADVSALLGFRDILFILLIRIIVPIADIAVSKKKWEYRRDHGLVILSRSEESRGFMRQTLR